MNQNIIKEYENYIIKMKYNTEKIYNEIKSLEDIKMYQKCAKNELEKLEKLSIEYKLYDSNYEDFMIAMGEYAIGLIKVGEFMLNNDKINEVDTFIKIHTEFEDLQCRNIMKDAYLWK